MTERTLIAITGGGGFLGSHLARAFRSAGAQVRLFDSAERPAWAVAAGIEYQRGDVRDAAAVRALVSGATGVIHAAFASPRQTTAVIRSVNIDGTVNVREAARHHGIRRIVLVSSTVVTGPPRAHPLWTTSPLSRLDLYRTTRIDAERILSQSTADSPPAAVVRPQSFLGAGRLGAFGIIFDLIRTGEAVPILGAGRHRYQLVGVRDLAEGIRLLMQCEHTGVFAFGARVFSTVLDDLQALIKHAGSSSPLRSIPAPLARVALRSLELSGGVPLSEWHRHSAWEQDSVIEPTRAERELGWVPKQSNLDAMIEAYDWYVDTLRATGDVPRTHTLPLLHRMLRHTLWLMPRA